MVMDTTTGALARRAWQAPALAIVVLACAPVGLVVAIPGSSVPGPVDHVNIALRLSRDSKGVFVPGHAWAEPGRKAGPFFADIDLRFDRAWFGSVRGVLRPIVVHQSLRFSAFDIDGHPWNQARVDASAPSIISALKNTPPLAGAGFGGMTSLHNSDKTIVLWRNVAHDALRIVSTMALLLTLVWAVRRAALFVESRTAAGRRARGLCPKCGYDLQGGMAAGCPECGWKRPS